MYFFIGFESNKAPAHELVFLYCCKVAIRVGVPGCCADFFTISAEIEKRVAPGRTRRSFWKLVWGNGVFNLFAAVRKSLKNDVQGSKSHLHAISRSSGNRFQSWLWRHKIRGIRRNFWEEKICSYFWLKKEYSLKIIYLCIRLILMGIKKCSLT